ncbi:hypothetical protein AB0I28_34115 [Phytomonospora sp. NPDC050363]|uniref:hypothetical protein n=1 Tax=Phytomonospora sp. NPDC050363 TaxID=3155642 RepID=UPI0033D9557B
MAHWLIVVDTTEYERQRMYAADTVTLPGGGGPGDGDTALLAADGVLFGAGTVQGGEAVYTHRVLEEPPALEDSDSTPGARPLDGETYARLSSLIPATAVVTAPVRDYLVSVTIPVEASSPAEAARLYWSYVAELGPAELPAFVAPYGDELDMRAYVLGSPHEMDPEEEDDEDE